MVYKMLNTFYATTVYCLYVHMYINFDVACGRLPFDSKLADLLTSRFEMFTHTPTQTVELKQNVRCWGLLMLRID